MVDYVKIESDRTPRGELFESDLFPTPLYRMKADDLPLTVNRDTIQEACVSRKRWDEGRVISNRSGWQSNDLVEANYKHLPILGLWDVCVDLSKGIGEKQGLLSEYQYAIGSSWININSSKYDHNIYHCHPGTYLACVYYVKCDKDSGNLVFGDPRPGNATNIPHADNLTVYNSVEINIEPEQGELILFPGWLYHYVASNQNDQKRITIAINIVLRR